MDLLPLLGAFPAQAAQDVLGQQPSRALMGLLDVIFIALAGWVAWRVISNLSKRRPPDEDNTYDVTPRDDEGDSGMDQRSRRAQAAWEYLTGQQGRDLRQPPAQDEPHEPDAPGTFNQAEFLRGAKVMFGRIKQSWAMRNLSDLRQFAAPDMMARFERWAAERPDRQAVSVLLVEAQVLEVQREAGRTVVEVAYQATVADDPSASRQVNEVWRFSREENVADAKWLLEDMAQRQ
ncbi:hypothetical protein NNJEOMEG_00424 [Fundidesulfovibrio magnetotacticus]|uniref:Tim44-like domain-containing protein n=1 Tax=Fundidesulfovibrio magnetotacticus TaxID=2730080 RepID=A0A6V8LR47_9BACT|nr:Tim44-like domain-containing protein [Fundidesulfovibrio magnetotacticus]GFK92599.1 hypothetical protein NNJEOMEG_00424 [Fundidesulfovibrio magnetotacticus]